MQTFLVLTKNQKKKKIYNNKRKRKIQNRLFKIYNYNIYY